MPPVTTEFFTHTQDVWDVMLNDIQAATKSVDIEQYIFALDEIGGKFLEVLIEKAKKGLRIRLLLDMVGSVGLYRSSVPADLERVGIEIRFFNPVSLWRIANFTSNFFRDHRKIMIIDGTIGHIGGVGIQDHMRSWRDTHVRVTGPLITDLEVTFRQVWKDVRKRFRFGFRQVKHFVKKFELLTNAPGFRGRQIYQTLIARIQNATNRIYITTPYFIPDVRLFRVLQLAAKRGVDVRLLVPSMPDHLFVNHAREAYFTLALKAGVKIYTYFPAMMHAKTVVIDDWGMVGSYNIDNLSASFNLEANLASDDIQFVKTLTGHFLDDLNSCNKVLYDVWIRRSLHKKFFELLTWPFHNIM